MTLEIKSGSTWYDITPYIAFGGIQEEIHDVDAPNAGRMIDGTMWRQRIARKLKLTVTCRPLTATEKHHILTLVSPQSFQVRYTFNGSATTYTMYANNFTSGFLIHRADGTDLYSDLKIPLVEV